MSFAPLSYFPYLGAVCLLVTWCCLQHFACALRHCHRATAMGVIPFTATEGLKQQLHNFNDSQVT
jgi:hypothetical protein